MESQQLSDPLRVVVAIHDDAQRETLASLLSGFADVEVVGCNADGRRALRMINQEQPDLVFVDRAMLKLHELHAIRKVLERGSPLIAFVMTRPQPVDAFEPNAIDYLLLPVTKDRMRVTLQRSRDRLDAASLAVQPSLDENTVPSGESLSRAAFLRRIPARTRNGFRIIPVEELVSVVAHAEYMHLTTTDGERHIILYRLKDLEARLDPAQFIRLSRSILVNIDFVRSVAPSGSGLLTVALTNGDELHVSRLRARNLRGSLLRL